MMKKGWILFLAVIFAAGLAGTTYASEIELSGALRVRAVTVDNSDRATGNTGEGFIEQRTRVNVRAGVNDTTKVFIQLQDSRDWGVETSTATSGDDVQAVDLSQGYLELSDVLDQPLTIRLGRQALAYGNHRLVGSFEWSNNARRFDAIKFMYKQDAFDVDAWVSKVSETNVGDGDTDFNGIYLTLKNIPDNTVELYLLNERDGSTASSQYDQDEYTYGARLNGKLNDADYTVEIVAQRGDTGTEAASGNSIERDALAYAIKAGYTFPDMLGGLRVGAEYDSGTGDETGSADKLESVNNLYPTNHYLYGFTDDIGWSDMQAWSVNVSAKPMDNLKVAVEYWDYSADEVAAGQSDDLGTEINIRANHKLNDNVSCELTYVLRDAGEAGDSGRPTAYSGMGAIPKDKTATFAYFMINVNF
jgi:hypothetical protein